MQSRSTCENENWNMQLEYYFRFCWRRVDLGNIANVLLFLRDCTRLVTIAYHVFWTQRTVYAEICMY